MEKTIEVDGISVTFDPVKASDVDVLEALCAVQDEQNDDFHRASETFRFMRLIFGNEQFERIKNELRAKNPDGVATIQDVNAFFVRVSEVSGEVKN